MWIERRGWPLIWWATTNPPAMIATSTRETQNPGFEYRDGVGASFMYARYASKISTAALPPAPQRKDSSKIYALFGALEL